MADAQSRLRERARLFQAQIRKRAAASSNGSSGSTDTQTTPTAVTAADTAALPTSTPDLVANGVDANNRVSQPVSHVASASHKRDAALRDAVDDSAVKKQRLSAEGSSAAACSCSSVDPLDAFMTGLAGRMTNEERRALVGDTAAQHSDAAVAPAAVAASPSPISEQKEPKPAPRSSSPAAAPSLSSASPDLERYFGDEEGAFDEDELDGLSRSESDSLLSAASRVKRKELKAVDHASICYIPIRKDFWIPSRDIAALSQQQVDELRRDRLEGVKIRGKNCPRPFLDWSQCGLSAKLLDVIAQSGYSRPFPIQSQAIPVIMSGRDCIACAKTGSGKCFARGTQLRLYTGDLIAVEHIVGGEQLMGDDGMPRTVTPGSLTQPGSRGVLYTVTPQWEGAEPFTVNGDHILVLANNERPWFTAETRQECRPEFSANWFELDTANVLRVRHRAYDSEERALDEVEKLTAEWAPLEWEVSVHDFLAAPSQTRSVCQLMAAEVVTFDNPQLPGLAQVLGLVLGQAPTQAQVGWAAWYLGLWLADGMPANARISRAGLPQGQRESHRQIMEELRRYQLLFGEPVAQEFDQTSPAGRDVHCFQFGRAGVHRGYEVSVAHCLLQQYGLLNNKHVPQAWVCDTLDVRRRIFAGIMDGDGCRAVENGSYEVSAKQLRVAQGYKLLGASLGLRTDAIKVQEAVDKRTGQKHNGHRLCFSGPMHTISQHVVCSHKQSPQPGAAEYVASDKNSRCYGFSITQQSEGEYFGFAVHGGTNRRFLLADFTITHNTLAFVLPLLRHALDQPPLEPGAGPIGLILAPTRELAVQIHYECRRFAKAVGLRVVCVYGGSAVAEQIASLKRGSDIIVATPGRLIDMLCANSGRVLSLTCVSYIVLDEADRMFDLGFEPQIAKVLELVRPDRQLVMFSATFPPSVEKLARKTLHDGIEIVIGGRSVASDSVTQYVEVRRPEDKFPRLLEILGKQFGNGSIIIFVDRQETVDTLFRQLMDASYPCLALHGGMDQADRDTILSDFKSGARSVLIATSVLSRGLDVKDCALVVNYSVPNHYEEYVHRVGRTGRAGKKGTAITMIETEGEEQYAGELVRALRDSGQVVPQDLQRMADDWAQRRRTGQVRYGASDGYGGKGFRFDEAEEAEKKEKERVLRLSSNPDADQQELQDMQDELREKEEAKQKKETEQQKQQQQQQQQQQQHRTQPSASSSSPPPPSAASLNVPLDPVARQLETAKAAALAAALSKIGNASDEKAAQAVKEAREKAEKRASEVAAERARAVAMALSSSRSQAAGGAGGAAASAGGGEGGVAKFSARIEINDYPQQARWAVTKKGSLDDVVGDTGCFITAKGVYVDGQRRQQEGEERLYLLVEGESEVAVMRCRNEIVRRLEESKREQEAKEASQFGMGGGAGGGGTGLGGAAGGSRGRYQMVLRLT